MVKVRYLGGLRDLMGRKEEFYKVKEGTTLVDLLLHYIPERHKSISKVWKEGIFRTRDGQIMFDERGLPIIANYVILINGLSYRWFIEHKKRPGLKYKLKDNDKISIIPPMGGG
ncbi:TPA: hypothetical protein EYP70_00385 [Candidatus Bathyarchaeota archaeon]|nr:hypothetical protein [Candidatus Bathyarchaeota archaeon]